jgi:site-specific DNA-methyltransferase (adenine-specific)
MTVTVLAGDCVARLAESTELFDACVCDPPYELGFMGKGWDSTGVAFDPATWRAVFDKLKPGAHLVAFGGTRTFHRMVVAIEDAGFEVRDQLAWVYGSGFPKSKNVALAIDKGEGHPDRGHRIATASAYHPDGTKEPSGDNLPPYEARSEKAARWQGWGTALKPAWEPICLARKPLVGTVAANVLAHGPGGLNIDATRVEHDEECKPMAAQAGGDKVFRQGGRREETTELKANGRFPANLLHDGSEEVLAGFPATGAAKASDRGARPAMAAGGDLLPDGGIRGHSDDGGSAARFFYSAKAGPLDRIGTAHATVKPVDLMRWLVRLVTPPGGHLLDPFAGSGTTGIAAMAEGFDATLIELEPDHIADIERKLAYLRGEGASRVVEHLKRKAVEVPADDHGPLFR